MLNKKQVIKYDNIILSIYLLLVVFGLIMQLNISSVRSSLFFFKRQIAWFAVSLIILWFVFKKIDLEKARKWFGLFVLITIILLLMVLFKGNTVKGGTRSFSILGINIQPSLLARVVMVLYFASVLDRKQKVMDDTKPLGFLKNFSVLVAITLIIYGLILVEKHFTPLIISGLTLISMLYLARIRKQTILLIMLILVLGGFMVLKYGPKYRNERMLIYKKYSLFEKLKQSNDDEYKGERDYQVRESLISLGTGKLFGTGTGKGTGKHYFLPDAKTDYIFAIIGEEYGFLGALLVLGLFFFLFIRSIINAQQQKSMFMRMACLGLGMNIFYNAMVNIGVAMSALPSTGVTLPFISYGGTSLVINSISIGLLLNISAVRR